MKAKVTAWYSGSNGDLTSLKTEIDVAAGDGKIEIMDKALDYLVRKVPQDQIPESCLYAEVKERFIHDVQFWRGGGVMWYLIDLDDLLN